jgi:signal transduction histidine kinase
MEGTKFRNFCASRAVKIIVFLFTVILAAAAWMQLLFISSQEINPECLIIKEYKDSFSFENSYVDNAYTHVSRTLLEGEAMPLNADYYYYVNDGKKSYSNVKSTNRAFFAQYGDSFYAYENGEWTFGENTNAHTLYAFDEGVTIYIAFSDEFMAEHQAIWETNRDYLMPYAISILICLLLSLFFLIWLICVTGRKPQDRQLHLSKLDSIYSDILLAALIGICFLFFAIVFATNIHYHGYALAGNMTTYEVYTYVLLGVASAAAFTLCLVVLLSLVRKIKAGKFLKHSLIYVVCYKVFDFFRSFFDGRKFEKYPLTKSLFYRQMLFIIASFILVLITFAWKYSIAILVPIFLEVVMMYWFIKGNRKTYEEINKGFNESLEEQMKAERMKIALITNVSHDLKTPLTSIISYVDLLSKEEDLSDSARDYVNILTQKSERLRHIVSDLFDLAKSTSGDIKIEWEKIDLKKLIEQTLADMSDEIDKSALKFKVSMPDHPVHVIADGKKMYRVFLNVFDNALKYSLDSTRVYVRLEEKDNEAVATIINTAGYEMDFTAEEILQRFNRGDKARSTEGNGLGLSIAESFTNVSGGDFQLYIDGDQFKTIIRFKIKDNKIF